MKKQYLISYALTYCLLVLPIFLKAQSHELDELLNLSLEELTNIQIITASKIPQRIKEVPATVRVISSEQIKNRGYFTLEEALADLPGMQFRNINGFNSYVFMRGIPSQNNLILVLIDGIQVNELNSGGFYGGAQYNLSHVERIEIVYGPAAALYGTNAISGIINIITKWPDKHQGLDINLQAGSFRTGKADAGYGWWNEEKKRGIRISGMVKTSDKADLSGDQGDNNWTETLDASEKDYTIDLRAKWQGFNFGVNLLNKQASPATYNKSVGTLYRDHGSLWNIRFINAFLKHNMQLNTQVGISSRIYYRNSTVLNNTIFMVTDTSQVGYYRPNALLGFESLVNYVPGEQINLISGLVLEREELAENYSKTYSDVWNARPPRPPRPEMQRNTLFSLYGQLKYEPLQSMECYAGVRFDNSSSYDQVLTPRVAWVFNRHQWTSKLLYTEAFRAPKPWDYSDGAGNTTLEPERMKSLEAYASWLLLPCLKLEGSVYKNLLDNLLVKQEVDRSWQWTNHGEIKTTGLEIRLEYKTPRLQSYFEYTLNRSTDEFNKQIAEISKHLMNLGLDAKLSRKLNWNIRGNYYGKRKNNWLITKTGSYFVDAAFVLQSAITCSITPSFSIQLSVKNLLDADYYHTSNLAPERYRQPERMFLLQASYHLK